MLVELINELKKSLYTGMTNGLIEATYDINAKLLLIECKEDKRNCLNITMI